MFAPPCPLQAALEAREEGRDAPRPVDVEEHAKKFFDEFFAMRFIEQERPLPSPAASRAPLIRRRRRLAQVHSIRKSLPSTGEAERLAVRNGTASADVVDRTFPLLPGSHLELADPGASNSPGRRRRIRTAALPPSTHPRSRRSLAGHHRSARVRESCLPPCVARARRRGAAAAPAPQRAAAAWRARICHGEPVAEPEPLFRSPGGRL